MNIGEHMGGGSVGACPPPRSKIKINRDVVGSFTSFFPVEGALFSRWGNFCYFIALGS